MRIVGGVLVAMAVVKNCEIRSDHYKPGGKAVADAVGEVAKHDAVW